MIATIRNKHIAFGVHDNSFRHIELAVARTLQARATRARAHLQFAFPVGNTPTKHLDKDAFAVELLYTHAVLVSSPNVPFRISRYSICTFELTRTRTFRANRPNKFAFRVELLQPTILRIRHPHITRRIDSQPTLRFTQLPTTSPIRPKRT